jgi:hypothetical protein
MWTTTIKKTGSTGMFFVPFKKNTNNVFVVFTTTIMLLLLFEKVSLVNSFATTGPTGPTRPTTTTTTTPTLLYNECYRNYNKYSPSSCQSPISVVSSPNRSARHRSSIVFRANNVDDDDIDIVEGKSDVNSNTEMDNIPIATAITSSPSSTGFDVDFDIIGIFGILASMVVLRSEFVLKTTGCGLPAGPFGLVGAIEGISYLGVVATAATAIVAATSKNKSNNDYDNDNNIGLLRRLAISLSVSAIIFGIFVLVFQIFDYGYIPNAVPMDGGMCE